MSDKELFSELIWGILYDRWLTFDITDELKVSKATLKRWSKGQSLPPKDVRLIASIRIGKILLERIESL
jgi:hypothetical protein